MRTGKEKFAVELSYHYLLSWFACPCGSIYCTRQYICRCFYYLIIIITNKLIVNRDKFLTIVRDVTQNTFKQSIDKILGHLTRSGKIKDRNVRQLFFGDYMIPEGEKIYDEVTDLKRLTTVMEQ